MIMATTTYKVTFDIPREDVKLSSGSVTITGLTRAQAKGVSEALGFDRKASYTMDLARKGASELDSLKQTLRVFQAAVQSKTLWFVEQQGAHERALARVKTISPGSIKGSSVVFGRVSVSRLDGQWRISGEPLESVILKRASAYRRDLEAAVNYCVNFDMILRQAQ